jgi:hypothetical protein
LPGRRALHGVTALSCLIVATAFVVEQPQLSPHLEEVALSRLLQFCLTLLLVAALIDTFLGLSRIARAEIRAEPVALTALAREVAEELANAKQADAAGSKQADAAGSKQADAAGSEPFAFEVEEGLVLRGDRRQLQILLTNLIENAAKYASGAERPRVRLARGRDAEGGRRSSSRTTAWASTWRTPSGSSYRSSGSTARSTRGWGWAWRRRSASCGDTAGASGPRASPVKARGFTSR